MLFVFIGCITDVDWQSQKENINVVLLYTAKFSSFEV